MNGSVKFKNCAELLHMYCSNKKKIFGFVDLGISKLNTSVP